MRPVERDRSRASRRRRRSRRPSGSRDRSSARPCRRPCAATGRASCRRAAGDARGRHRCTACRDRTRPRIVHRRSRNAARLGELRVLARHHLRLRPVDVEDLRLAGLERGEIFVEAPLLDLALLVVGWPRDTRRARRTSRLHRGREDAADHAHSRCFGSPDERRPRPCLRVCRGSRAPARPAARQRRLCESCRRIRLT